MHAQLLVLEIPYGVHLSKFLSDDHDGSTPAMRDRFWEREEADDDRPWVSWRVSRGSRFMVLKMGDWTGSWLGSWLC
ncbi:hypothetical protein N431DRAFT_205201 [Stipitochalara longipes BDJ]|nr:hypothetical protein N431DRAFT_205201 [Stipitochalara longipes BDJ]